MSYVLNIVATECKPEEAVRFNNWYNDVHIPLLMKYPGITKVTRYRLQGESKGAASYLACYEFNTMEDVAGLQQSNEFKAAMAEMQQSWPDGGFDIQWAAVYEPVKTWAR